MKIFLWFILISMSINCYSQFTIDSFYQDKSTLLITSKVINLDGKLKNDIKSGFKNWVSTKFVNLKEVIVSETDEQIVIVYLTEFYTKLMGNTHKSEWYIRLIADFKDNKIRVRFIDDGNAYWPAGVGTSARTYRFQQYFQEWGKDGEPSKRFKQGIIEFKNNIEFFSNSISLQKNEEW